MIIFQSSSQVSTYKLILTILITFIIKIIIYKNTYSKNPTEAQLYLNIAGCEISTTFHEFQFKPRRAVSEFTIVDLICIKSSKFEFLLIKLYVQETNISG